MRRNIDPTRPALYSCAVVLQSMVNGWTRQAIAGKFGAWDGTTREEGLAPERAFKALKYMKLKPLSQDEHVCLSCVRDRIAGSKIAKKESKKKPKSPPALLMQFGNQNRSSPVS
jgi:hypothetical protein